MSAVCIVLLIIIHQSCEISKDYILTYLGPNYRQPASMPVWRLPMLAITHITPEMLDAAKLRAVALRQAAMRDLVAKLARLMAPSAPTRKAGKACVQC